MQMRVPMKIEQDPRLTLASADLVLAATNRFPVVAKQKRGRDGGGLAMGITGALALGAITFVSMSSTRQTPRVAPAPVLSKPKPMIADAIAPTAQPLIAQPAPALPPLPAQQPTHDTAERAQAPSLIMDTYAPQTLVATTTESRTATPASKPTPGGLSNDESFAFRVGESGVDLAKASTMINPSTTVAQGTLIAAVLETGINSDLPGYVRAFVSQDVRGFDNKSVLIPRGSRLIGQYKSGVSAGQTRALILWSRLMRPDGVSVALASPTTDLAGETGLPGKVNEHFMQRFGAAILLSIIGGVATSRAGTVIVSGASGAATVAAQSSATISPTIHVAQGEPIRIFTARDLDFTDVAALSVPQ